MDVTSSQSLPILETLHLQNVPNVISKGHMSVLMSSSLDTESWPENTGSSPHEQEQHLSFVHLYNNGLLCTEDLLIKEHKFDKKKIIKYNQQKFTCLR